MKKVTDARVQLTRWGDFWRRQLDAGLGYAPIGPGQKLIYLARLGCRIQQNAKHDLSDNIRVPPSVAVIDDAIATLPRRQQWALRTYYIQFHKYPRRKIKDKDLLEAETRIMQLL